MDSDSNANLDHLAHLLLIWHRNNIRSNRTPPSATLEKAEHDFLWYAITQERAAHNLPQVLNVILLQDNPPSVQHSVMEALEIDESMTPTEANEQHLVHPWRVLASGSP